MDKRLLKLAFKSIKRRWKEIGRACLATFLSVFFVTAILIFEENMFEWQIASNKEKKIENLSQEQLLSLVYKPRQ